MFGSVRVIFKSLQLFIEIITVLEALGNVSELEIRFGLALSFISHIKEMGESLWFQSSGSKLVSDYFSRFQEGRLRKHEKMNIVGCVVDNL